MRKLLFIVAFLGLGISAQGQQQFVFTNFLMNDYYYSPAVAGMKDVHMANVGFRAQWAGFDEAPRSLYANYYGSFRNEQKHGYGASIINDRSGLVSNTGFLINYVYHLKLNETMRLAFGVKPGFQQYNIKLYDALLADEGDPMLTGNVLSTGAFDLQAGLNWYSEKFFVMASMRHIFGEAVKFTGFNDGLSKHYTAIVGYNWNLNKKKKVETDSTGTSTSGGPADETGSPKKKKKDFILTPVVMMNYVFPMKPQASFMLRASYDNKFWGGLTYRMDDAAGVSIGFVIKNRFHIGYSFDYSLGDVQNYNSGSHEIVLSFQTTSKKPSLDEQDEQLNNSIFDENKEGKKKDKE
ncbi:MAG: type IX secretion system membrane protein PorP/SprF [Crocinitomicaceae bacterium]|nr:type IX secretion system membrane protein PorP/SprF [Crocinitomicaceae bacterium]